MLKVQKIEDVYPAIKELIAVLKPVNQHHLADVLYQRMYQDVWTTGSELLEELAKVLSQALTDNNLSPSLRNQMEQIILVIGDWFNRKPDFYLTLSESDILSKPRECYVLKKIAGIN